MKHVRNVVGLAIAIVGIAVAGVGVLFLFVSFIISTLAGVVAGE